MNAHSSWLLSIGPFADRLLPSLLTAFSCRAALPVDHLHIFRLSPQSPEGEDLSSMAELYSDCPFFPSSFSVESCSPVFPSSVTLSDDPDTVLLLSALRGRGMPLSFRTDREAVEWAFTILLNTPEDTSVAPFFSWLSGLRSALNNGASARLTLLADLSDPFSAGIALAALRFLRSSLSEYPVSVYLLALAETSSSLSASFFPALRASLESVEGADALWLLSLPSSMAETPDAHQITSLAAARILSRLFTEEQLPSPGFHAYEIDGTLSLHSLGDQAAPFAAFLTSAVWLLSDLIPAVRSYLAHPNRLRTLGPNSRGAFLRRLFPSPGPDLSPRLEQLDQALRICLKQILSFFRSVPSSLRLSADTAALWQQAVSAYGRYITVAAEYDTTSAEVHETGLDTVRPVHRDSLADTDEEQLLRRVEDMRKQLDHETALRNEKLSALGGFRALQVRADCLSRCRSALDELNRKPDSVTESLESSALMRLKRTRRVRLLCAAIARCESELTPSETLASLSTLPKSASAVSDPYAGDLLTSEAGHVLERLLSHDSADFQDHIPPLFPDLPAYDAKSLLKSLMTACRDVPVSEDPLIFLLSQVYAVCLQSFFSCRFLSRGDMPSVPMLPDLLALSLPVSVQGVLSLMPSSSATVPDYGERRGLLAMLLLRQYRRRTQGEARIVSSVCRAENAVIPRYWLSSHHAAQVVVLSLARDEDIRPFALILPDQTILPAFRSSIHISMIPSFVTWFDSDSSSFSDPCSFLGEGDRLLLCERLRTCLAALPENPVSPLRSFLADYLSDLSVPPAVSSNDSALKTRLQAACGLAALPAYAEYIRCVPAFYEHFLPDDLVLSALSGQDAFPASVCSDIPEEVLYFWQDIPFARKNSRLLLDSPKVHEEAYALSRLADECAALCESSDDFRDALMNNLHFLLEQYPDALPENRAIAQSLLDHAGQPISGRDPSFLWPWDPLSPSLRTILSESLGDQLAEAALSPFSDLLALFPARGGDVIGDSMLSSLCILPVPAVSQESAAPPTDAVLPPFSPSFSRALCTLEEGRTLIQPGLLSFERLGESAFRVTLTLDGAFPVHLQRKYAASEVINLYSHEIPTVAVWPSVPFRPDDWHAYYIYAHLADGYTLSVLPESGEPVVLPCTSPGRFSDVLSSFPLCISLFREDCSLGSLPNLLPRPELTSSGHTEICMDFGSVGTSVICMSSGRRKLLQGPVMIRTLLNNPASSRDLLRLEFLPAVPVSALLPTVTRLFRNAPGAAPVPFSDGIVLMSADLQDLLSTPSDAIYTCLKWQEEKGRSGLLCLHQILLMAALQARSDGAASLSFRFAIPDEMAREGRESLMNLFISLGETVLRETGFQIPPEGLPIAFASESSALGAYFRYCSPEDTRGGFMVLDLGACTADISLFLRSREQAVRVCQIPLGVHYMLLPSLLKEPDLLSLEFGAWPDELFRQNLSLLSKALSAARTDPVALRRARIALDYFLSDHLPVLITAMSQLAAQGIPTRFGALLLLHFAYLMMLAGLVLLQLAADPNKNDFLPEQMSLCLAGRGAALMEALPPPLKKSLWHFLTMFRNRRVASLSLLFSSEKKLEIPVGLSLLSEIYHMLPPAASVPASIAVRPEELLPEFLLRFRREFPASADLLFPGFFTQDAYHPFSSLGESIVSSAISQSFAPAEPPRPYDSLSAFPGNLLDLLT